MPGLFRWRQLWNIKRGTSESPETTWELAASLVTQLEKMAMKNKHTSNSPAMQTSFKHITKHCVNYCPPPSPVFSKHLICRAIALYNVLLFRSNSKSQHLEPALAYLENIVCACTRNVLDQLFSKFFYPHLHFNLEGNLLLLSSEVLGPQNGNSEVNKGLWAVAQIFSQKSWWSPAVWLQQQCCLDGLVS